MTGECHSALSKPAYPHAPVADDCLSCHIAVSEAHPQAGQKTFKLTADGAQLCFQCHAPFAGKRPHAPVKDGDCLSCHQVHGAANPYLLEVGEDLTELCFGCHDDADFRREFRHGPAAAGACTGCHDPHAADDRKLLRKPGRAACLECHADFAAQMQAATVIHEPVRESPCTECHDPHAAAARYVLKKKMPDLCLSCHEDFGDRLAAVKVRHAPVEDEGSCSNCHSTHFSNVPNLLPAEEQDMCFGCHASDKLGNPPLKNIKKEIFEKPAPPRGKRNKAVRRPADKHVLLHDVDLPT